MAARPEGRVRWDGGPPDGLSAGTGTDALVWLGCGDDVMLHATGIVPTPADRVDAGRLAERARPAFLLRRALMRLCIGRWLGVPLADVVVAYDAGRRPRLLAPAGSLFVSSGSRDGCHAVALASRPVGVDIERIAGAGEPAWAVLAAGERQRLEALPAGERHAAFLALWTAKEATLKALGLGLSRAPETIAIEPDPSGRFAIRDGGRPLPVRVAESRTVREGREILQAACVVLD